LGHNVSFVTSPNCFSPNFSRLKRVSKIGLAVFPRPKCFRVKIPGVNLPPEIALGVLPKPECFGIGKFRVKNENQNWFTELAQRYGMPAADLGNDIGKRWREGGLALAPSDRAKACSS